MSALFGFVVGYVVGARAGNEGFERLEQAWRDIRGSDEFQSFVQLLKSHVSGSLQTAGERLKTDGVASTMLADIEDRAAAARARFSLDD